MDISPAGFLYILLIGYFILHHEKLFANLFMLTLVTEVFLRMGYVVKIGDSNITYQGLSQYVLIGYCMLHLQKIPKHIKRGWLLLVSSFVIPILMLIIFPSNVWAATIEVSWDEVLFEGASLRHPSITGFVLKANLKVIMMTIVYVYIYKEWTEKDYRWAVGRFSEIANVFLFIGILEFLIKNVFGFNEGWGNLLVNFWGETESTVFEGRLRGDTYELNLFTQEASHYANILMFVCIAKFANNIIINKKRKLDLTIWIALSLMAMSTSFSAVYTSATFFAFFFLHRWYIQKPKTVFYEKLVVVGVVIVIITSLAVLLNLNSESFVGARLLNLSENFEDIFTLDWGYGRSVGDNSTQIRMVSMIQTLVVFLNRPLFGYSYQAIVCHSATAKFLAGVGFYGLYCWARFYFSLIPLRKILLPSKLLYVGIFVLLIKNILGGDDREFFGLMLIIISISFNYYFSVKYHCITKSK